MATAGNPIEPIGQFAIKEILPMEVGGINLAFTNSALFMLVGVVIALGFLMIGSRQGALVPNRFQLMVESVYGFIAEMLRDNVGSESRKYFPFVFTIFVIVMMGNLLGMLPLMHSSFTYTSHIAVTGALALTVFIFVTAIGFIRHGLHFFSFFVPPGAPWWMLPLVVPVEIISYLSRPISLSVRLFANMLVGHAMLKVFAGFVVVLGVFGIFPILFNVVFVGFEIFVAMIQAYVFTLLTCIYLHDAVHMH